MPSISPRANLKQRHCRDWFDRPRRRQHQTSLA